MWLLYQILYAVVLLAAAPVLLLRRGSHYLSTFPGRLAFQRAVQWQVQPGTSAETGSEVAGCGEARRPLWIHAVSVGEVAVADTLVRSLPEDEPLLITTVTPTGQAQARRRFAGRATVAYLPFELGFAVRRFYRRHAPRALVLVEGDYWPRMLRGARRRGLPVAVVNGRVGDASFRRQSALRRLPLLRRLLRPLFGPVGRFGVQSDGDRRRLEALGVAAETITVTGNLKFDSPPPAALPELEARLGDLAGGRAVLLAGSTMGVRKAASGVERGEEDQVVDAFLAAGGGERAMLVLAPRHPERWDEVHRLLEARGLEVLRRSRLETEAAEAGAAPRRPAVVLLDSLGELAALYRVAAAAFIGGTLVPTGGHNPLEPALFGVPVVVGPSMDNFRDMAAQFRAADAWRQVADAEALGRTWKGWLDDPAAARQVGERARRLVEENRGSVERTLEMLRPVLDGETAAAAAPPPPRSPWQRLYAAAHRARRAWYRRRARSLPRPVVSIGNLHWGGTGKTPLTAAVAAHLRDRGLRVCVLSRGYGAAAGRREARVVSDGAGPVLPPEDAGDEPVLLARQLPGVAVVVAVKRWQGGNHALRRLSPPPDLFLLDDGFSHLALGRDLDLLVFPAADPFAGGRLPPGGRLREPLAAAARADAVLLTGLPPAALGGEGSGGRRAAARPGEGLAAALRHHGFTGPGFACALAAEPPRRLDGGALEAGTRVLLVSAIARPGRFHASADRACREAGLEIVGRLVFRDHHPYPEASLGRIRRAADEAGAAVVLTTSKDRVKLEGRLELPLAELPVRARPEAAFWTWLDRQVDELVVPRTAEPDAAPTASGPPAGRGRPPASPDGGPTSERTRPPTPGRAAPGEPATGEETS